MPRYRENPLLIPFTMLCPGISQNTEQHQLTFFNGQILEEKSYLELCNNNVLNILYSWTSNWNIEKNPIEKIGKLYVPPELGLGFIEDGTQIPWDSEILQSFAELTNSTSMTFDYFDSESIYYPENVTYQIYVGNFKCGGFHYEKCVPPSKYYPWYIWTKEGFQKISLILTLKDSILFDILNLFPVSTTRIPDSQSFWII